MMMLLPFPCRMFGQCLCLVDENMDAGFVSAGVGHDFPCLGLQCCCRMVFSNGFADFVQGCCGFASMT